MLAAATALAAGSETAASSVVVGTGVARAESAVPYRGTVDGGADSSVPSTTRLGLVSPNVDSNGLMMGSSIESTSSRFTRGSDRSDRGVSGDADALFPSGCGMCGSA